MAPVFENVDLGLRQTSFQALIKFGAAAIAAAEAAMSQIEKQDPTNYKNNPVYTAMTNVIYYVGVATPQPPSPWNSYKGRHLVDVAQYWPAP